MWFIIKLKVRQAFRPIWQYAGKQYKRITSSKVFIGALMLSIGIGWTFSIISYRYEGADTMRFVREETADFIKPNDFAFENPSIVPVAYAKQIEVEAAPEKDLVDYIFMKESSRGVKNYSKCEAIGKYNRYGFDIPGDGSYVCFEKDEDTKAVAGWVAHRKALGMSDKQLLCLYNTGDATESCEYIKQF